MVLAAFSHPFPLGKDYSQTFLAILDFLSTAGLVIWDVKAEATPA
jgi:hypothetical protein